MLTNQNQTNSHKDSNLLFYCSLLLIASLPFFAGKILYNSHAYVFGLYVNYLHIRVTLQLIISCTVFYFYARIKPLTLIKHHFLVAFFIILFVSLRAFSLGKEITGSGLMYFLTSSFYSSAWILQMLAIVFSLKTLWANKEQRGNQILLAIGTSIFLQACIVYAQYITKGPVFPQHLAWLGQPTVFTSFSQIGIYDVSRIYGTTPHPNILGAILTLYLFLLTTIEQKSLLKYLLLFITSTLALLTLSKSALIAILGMLIIYLFDKKTPMINKGASYYFCIILSLLALFILPYMAQKLPQLSFITTRAQIEMLYVSLLERKPWYLLFGSGFHTSIPALYHALETLSVSAIFNSHLLAEPPHHVLLLSIVEFGIPVTVFLVEYIRRVIVDLTENQPQWMYLSVVWLLLVFGSLDHFLLY